MVSRSTPPPLPALWKCTCGHTNIRQRVHCQGCNARRPLLSPWLVIALEFFYTIALLSTQGNAATYWPRQGFGLVVLVAAYFLLA